MTRRFSAAETATATERAAKRAGPWRRLCAGSSGSGGVQTGDDDIAFFQTFQHFGKRAIGNAGLDGHRLSKLLLLGRQ